MTRGVSVHVSIVLLLLAQLLVRLRQLFREAGLDKTLRPSHLRLLLICAQRSATRLILLVPEEELGDLLIVVVLCKAHLAIVVQLLKLAHLLPGHEVAQNHLLQHPVVFVELAILLGLVVVLVPLIVVESVAIDALVCIHLRLVLQ